MKKLFITGATGFIGTSLIKKMCEDKDIYALALPGEVDKLKNFPNINIIEGNLENIDSIIEIMQGIGIDTIYHLAWIGVSTEYKNNFEIQSKNIQVSMNVMKLAHNCKCKRVIATGSISEYAYYDGKIDGTQLPAPCDVYSATKVAVHTYCDLFARQNDINFNWVLIPSIYGPGRNDSNLITYCIKKLLLGEKPSFTKLEQQWDYIYISDLVQALIQIGENAKGNTVYPVGSGQVRKMSEYVEIIKNSINPNAELGIGDLPYKTSRIDNAIVDIKKTTEDTGYIPQVIFEEGIQKTIDYFRKEENQYV